jgi:capsular exopolysaccharide synthesis family protein
MTRMTNAIDEISSREFIEFLMRSWKWIAVSSLIAGSIVVILHVIKPAYKASAIVQFQDSNNHSLQAVSEKLIGMEGVRGKSLNGAVNDFTRLLSSGYFYRSVAAEIVADMPRHKTNIETLLSQGGFFNGLWGVSVDELTTMEQVEAALARVIRRSCHFEQISDDVIRVTATTVNPLSSTIFVNAITHKAISTVTSGNLQELNATKDFVTKLYDQVNERISSLQTTIVKLKKEASIGSINSVEMKPIVTKIKADLAVAESKLLQNQELVELLAGKLNVNYDLSIANRIEKLRFEQDYWRTNIHSNKTTLKKLRQSIATNNRNAYFEQATDDLGRQREFEYSVLAELKKQLLTIDVQRISVQNKIRILEAAELRAAQQKPLSKFRIIAAIIMLNIIVLLIRFINQAAYPVVKHPSELSSYNIRFLGQIPRIRKAKAKEKGSRSKRKRAVSVPLLAIRSESEESTVFRALRQKIVCMFNDSDEIGKMLAILSPRSNDGKTTVATNLACSFSQGGKKTLLIGADFRKDDLPKLFGVEEGSGLSDLAEPKTQEKMKIPVREVRPNLHVLPSGTYVANMAEFFFTKRFEQIISQLRKQYDFVVLDTPPIFAVPETLAMARVADLGMLIVNQHETKRDDAEAAMEELMLSGCRRIAWIMNRSDMSKDGSYTYYSSRASYVRTLDFIESNQADNSVDPELFAGAEPIGEYTKNTINKQRLP